MEWNYPITNYVLRRFSRPLAARLATSRITPNQITVISGVMGLGGAGLIALEYIYAAVFILFISEILDCTDGDLARIRGQASRYGAYLDHMMDRWVDGALVVALIFLDPSLWMVGLLAMMGTYLATAPRTKAEAEGVTCLVGIATRDFRLLIWWVGLLLAQYFWLLAALALLGFITSLHRTGHSLSQLKSVEEPHEAEAA
ncbi:MAG: CDP-alcohol phosphatidyltransferase family protein [Thermoplasmata archaeon]